MVPGDSSAEEKRKMSTTDLGDAVTASAHPVTGLSGYRAKDAQTNICQSTRKHRDKTREQVNG